ncbi:carboxypeptidase-like regulatory domain-containing protein [Novipirellula sp. SH528]|uniref:carboxypeptidase-like regulatory domain-containing protein n=1 Tax=Novipirellula sp. SH528 TaxID=3454466 RepID=UPI003F9F105E
MTAPLIIHGQEPPTRFDDDQLDRQTANENNVRVTAELAAHKQTISRLETKIDRLLSQPSEFSAVEVQIIDERAELLSDFEVRLTSIGDVQAAEASGTSNGDGIGLARDLPYGHYWMTVSGKGWYVRNRVTVEVGSPLNLIVVATTSDQLGELVLQASL